MRQILHFKINDKQLQTYVYKSAPIFLCDFQLPKAAFIFSATSTRVLHAFPLHQSRDHNIYSDIHSILPRDERIVGGWWFSEKEARIPTTQNYEPLWPSGKAGKLVSGKAGKRTKSV